MALLVCIESFTRFRNGVPSTVAAGDVIDSSDWRVQGKARDGTPIAQQWCEPAEETVERQREVKQVKAVKPKVSDKAAASTDT